MKLTKNIIALTSILFLFSCADYNTRTKNQKKEKSYYSSIGFALIYEDGLYNEKIINKQIDNEKLELIHRYLKRNTPVKIINPDTLKVVESKVHKKGDFPKIFNVVISQKIASILELDHSNPYVEIIEVKKNKTFIAKESNTFDEEKKVAEKVPLNEVKMDDLSKVENKNKKKLEKDHNFILVVSDFYYENSAMDLMNSLIKKTKVNNLSIKKINDKKYRLFAGPFKNFRALKTTYISLNKIGFEDLTVLKE